MPLLSENITHSHLYTSMDVRICTCLYRRITGFALCVQRSLHTCGFMSKHWHSRSDIQQCVVNNNRAETKCAVYLNHTGITSRFVRCRQHLSHSTPCYSLVPTHISLYLSFFLQMFHISI